MRLIEGWANSPGADDREHAYLRLYEHLRKAILTGQLRPGARLPPSRRFADELGVSRNTVLAALDQLLAEGYIQTRPGSGTYVARVLPERMQHARGRPASVAEPALTRRTLSSRGMTIASAPRMPLPSLTRTAVDAPAFQIGLPALEQFPHELWARLYGNRFRHRSVTALMRYDDPAGYRPLREQIAAHIATTRGIRCTADQVVVVAGSQQGLELSSRILLDPGDPVWLEDPCYLGAKAALVSSGARIIPVPVDGDGLDVGAGVERSPDARLAVVTPSHQFPFGVTLSLQRRLALIEWAEEAGAWIIEDDYASEFRYRRHPLAALQSIDPYGRVIYLGTFSKTMFPGLRLGYAILPRDLVDGFAAAHLSTDIHPNLIDQAVLADFLAEGHYARHVRRMRVLYGQRLRALVSAAKRDFTTLRTGAPDGGLHLLAWLPNHLSDTEVAKQALSSGIHAWPLSIHVLEKSRPPALLLGFASVPAEQIPSLTRNLAEIIEGM